MTVPKKLTKARAALVMRKPFFGSMILRLDPTEWEGTETMATDGNNLFYNSKFIEDLTLPELQGVLAHETMHCALGHMSRRGEREHEAWNIACDYAINSLLISEGFDLPDGALIEKKFDGMSAEQIYGRLPKSPDGKGNDKGKPGADPGRCGGVMDAPSPKDGKKASPAELSKIEKDWKVNTLQAAQNAVAAGSLGGDVKIMIDGLKKSKIDWRTMLRRFMSSTAKNDYSWSRPNRRFVWQNIYLPSAYSNELGVIIIAIDTSSSIDLEAVKQSVAELSAIADELKPERIHVLYCNTALTNVETFEQGDPIKANPKGRGGTDFRPPFDWVKKQGINPACFIYLTDLQCSRWPEPPPYPVLWATYAGGTAPFGEVIDIVKS